MTRYSLGPLVTHVAGCSLEDIRKRGVSHVRVNPNVPVHSFCGRENKLAGFDIRAPDSARSLVLRSKILWLDEITAALDPELVHEALSAIRIPARAGMTLLIVSHELNFVREISDLVVMMDAGCSVESGPASEIFNASRVPRTREFMRRLG